MPTGQHRDRVDGCRRAVERMGRDDTPHRAAAGSASTATPVGRRPTNRMAETYEGYCVKCREKRHYHGEVRVSDSGRRMARGICPVCGTIINRILGRA
jgi:Domain of unknown function (DUF5679)